MQFWIKSNWSTEYMLPPIFSMAYYSLKLWHLTVVFFCQQDCCFFSTFHSAFSFICSPDVSVHTSANRWLKLSDCGQNVRARVCVRACVLPSHLRHCLLVKESLTACSILLTRSDIICRTAAAAAAIHGHPRNKAQRSIDLLSFVNKNVIALHYRGLNHRSWCSIETIYRWLHFLLAFGRRSSNWNKIKEEGKKWTSRIIGTYVKSKIHSKKKKIKLKLNI